MDLSQLIVIGFTVAIMVCSFIAICLTFYLGRTRIKEVDRFLHGYETPEDSIFYQGIRLMNYGGAFAWHWSAKRSKLLHLRDHFDKKFQRPFIVMFYLYVIGGSSIALLYVLDKFFLKVVY